MNERTVHVPYFDELVKCPVGARLLSLNVWPDAKEVSESLGAYAAVRRYLPDLLLSDRTVTVIVVGDGSTPRTAATFALRSAWQCHSVDPTLARTQGGWWKPTGGPIDRLHINPCRVEDARFVCDGPAIIVAVHSHATLPAALASVVAPRVAVVAMPCCVPQVIDGQEPDVIYEDHGILSPMRRVMVWRSVVREVVS